jgi:hypothetical protein
MHDDLKIAYRRELDASRAAQAKGDNERAFLHLERAHILSQRFAFAHAATHLRMLRLGWQQRDGKEVRGQISRALAALVFSRIWVPQGTSGRARVSAFTPTEDLASLLDGERRAS